MRLAASQILLDLTRNGVALGMNALVLLPSELLVVIVTAVFLDNQLAMEFTVDNQSVYCSLRQ